jgi:glycosyltransferase involved in cell wall biosynthesis
MKLSIYTAVRNGLENDFHVEAMLRHHARLVDEIVVNEGYSTDGTYERIRNIGGNVRTFRSHWGEPRDINWYVRFKEEARKQCTGDWCILLDCDEFIPEWEFEKIREALSQTDELMLPAKFINFYGNYRVFHGAPEVVNWPARKMIIHRNDPRINIWGDGSNVKIKDQEFRWGDSEPTITVHHFGMVRDPGILRYKWWMQGRTFQGRVGLLRPPRMLFKLFPHNWMDAQFFDNLELYRGPLIEAVRKEPAEFTRDGMRLAEKLGWAPDSTGL